MEARNADSVLVSVIVPVRDGVRWIAECLDALRSQSFSAADMEVIVVDNGSTDGTRELVDGHPVTLIEDSTRRSPYVARNAGLKIARGAVVAFTDADCRPDRDWIARGAAPLLEGRADLVAGNVIFDLGSSPTLGELTDALWHLDVAAQVERNRAAMTSNLFVTRAVVNALGPFDGRLRSGGDGRWTRRASDSGFRLVYVPEATVSKRARRLVPLLAKAYRVGTGLPAAWIERGTSGARLARGIFRQFLPPAPSRVKEQILHRGYDVMRSRAGALWAATWLLEATRGAGAVAALFETSGRTDGRAAARDDGHGS